MITEALLSLVSFYPWNIGVSGYYTIGDYSTHRTYRSEKAFLSLDRRGKDALVVSFEHLEIDDSVGLYKQNNILIRNVAWIKPEFRLGSVAGVIHSNSIEEGWLLGAQLEGDLPWLGYSADYAYLEFQGWEPLSSYWDITKYSITQWGLGLSRRIGPVVVRAQAINQNTWGESYQLFSGKATLDLGRRLFLTLYGSSGESRYALDPYLLVLDNNPDIMNQTFGLYGTYRITPNISLSCEALRKEYSPIFEFDGSTDYHILYAVFGFQLRY